MVHPHPSTNTQVIVNIFQTFANSKKTLETQQDQKWSQIEFSEGIFFRPKAERGYLGIEEPLGCVEEAQ